MTEQVNSQAESYDPIKDPMHPMGKECTICNSSYNEEEWGVMGWIGILPVSFCPDCEAGIFNMVYALSPIEALEELIADKRLEEQSPKDVTPE